MGHWAYLVPFPRQKVIFAKFFPDVLNAPAEGFPLEFCNAAGSQKLE